MILTRLWAVILAVLATACLAGMFMLSAGASGDFDDSDRDSLRAITEAGVAALDAEIKMSHARLATSLANDPRIRDAIERIDADPEEVEPGQYPLPQVLADVTEEHRLAHEANTTLAVIDRTGKLVAVNGIAEPAMGELVMVDAYKEVPLGESALFSVLLGGELYVANVMVGYDSGHRLVAAEPLNIGAGSVLRRVLGATQPAGLVRKDKLVGGIIGDQPLGSEIKVLAAEHHSDTPVAGASRVFSVGEGLDRRLGALGRLPGPAGEGPSGVVLAVVSRRTAAAGQQDLGEALRDAREKGVRLNWVLLGSLLVISVALAVYLPSLEAAGPIRRLISEFQAVSTGAQHQIFHDRYGGAAGHLARTAAGTIEALRQAFLAELEIDEDDVGEPAPPSRVGRSARARRLTRGHERLRDAADEAMGPTERPPERAASAPTAALDVPSGAAMPTPPEPDPTQTQQTPHRPNPPPGPQLPGTDEGTHTAPMDRRPMAAPPTASLLGAKPPPPPAPAAAPRKPVAHAPPKPQVPPSTAEPRREDYYREIFEEFVQVKVDCGEPTANLSFERFAAKLRKNARDLKVSRPDITDVRFTVYIKDGKAALKAKVVR